MSLTIYDYDGASGEIIGSRPARAFPGREGWADGTPGKYQISANATDLVPPAANAGYAVCFRNGAWTQVADHRGETWWKAYGEPVVIEQLGQEVGLSSTEPAPPPPTWADLQAKAVTALARSDLTMLRVTEAVACGLTTFNAADVIAYVKYRRSLRAIVSAPTGDATQALPTQPAFPIGT